MFFVLGFLIAILTFPGVFVHETAHRFFCDLAGVPVYKVCYFRAGNPSGYVIHGQTDRLAANLLISIGPLIINTILCAVICFTPIVAYDLGVADTPIVFLILLWLGISIGIHVSDRSGRPEFLAVVRDSGRRGPLYGVAKGFEYLVRPANLLRVVWFDLIYAIGVAVALPALVALATAN
jgi:hypothetical protein